MSTDPLQEIKVTPFKLKFNPPLFTPSDSTYTERYMGMPNLTDNYQGYEEGDLSKHVDSLKDKQFLLVRILFVCSMFAVKSIKIREERKNNKNLF